MITAIMERWAIKIGIGYVLSVLGCSTVAVHAPHHIEGRLDGMNRAQLANRNTEMLQMYQEETAFYPSVVRKHATDASPRPSSTETRPQTCISLSGGGIRSAAFAIGIMKGLEELPSKPRFLRDVDVMSGASGGSYALSWYIANLRKGHYTRDNIFGDSSLNYLKQHSDFITVPMEGASVFGSVIGIPFNLLFDAVFGWHLNTNPIATTLYEIKIENTFHGGERMHIRDIAALLEGNRADPHPIPIVTTTWRIDEDQLNQESLLANSVVEVTPWWYGSDGLGYVRHSATPRKVFADLGELVEVSGSALDASQSIGASARVLGSVFNMDLGRYFYNYYDQRIGQQGSEDQRSFWSKALWYISPLGTYLFQTPYWRDAYGERIYLTDGGHAENLAAWPLIRRLCDHIVMVDGEYDPDYSFGAYFRLKHAVEKELHAKIQLTPEPKAGLDVEGIEPAIAAGQTLNNIHNNKPGNWREKISRQRYPKQHAVLHGTIGPLPVNDSAGKSTEITLQLTYIKLAIGEGMDKAQLLEQYGEAATTYYLASRSNSCQMRPYVFAAILWHCSFPMYDTVHQNFAPEQFAAYIGLGEHIVKNQLMYEKACGYLRPKRWTGCTP